VSLGPRSVEQRGGAEPRCLGAALAYAAHGWAVLPVHGIVEKSCGCGGSDCSSPGKHPLTRHGCKEASSDSGVIEAWWRRWPHANLALVTGSASGVVVVDVDPPAGESSLERVAGAGYPLPQTLTVRTGSGGTHLYYRAFEPLGNSAGRLPGVDLELPGVDLRAEGGYVVAPPSLHVSGARYRWIEDELRLAAAPPWLRSREPRSCVRPVSEVVPAGGSSRYGLAALEEELGQLRRAPVGGRNHALNRAAFCLGQLIAGGELVEADVVDALRAVSVSRGLSRREVERTISSGLAAGRLNPRRSPPR